MIHALHFSDGEWSSRCLCYHIRPYIYGTSFQVLLRYVHCAVNSTSYFFCIPLHQPLYFRSIIIWFSCICNSSFLTKNILQRKNVQSQIKKKKKQQKYIGYSIVLHIIWGLRRRYEHIYTYPWIHFRRTHIVIKWRQTVSSVLALCMIFVQYVEYACIHVYII